ncbi:MAG: 4Fe-4S dicluster domain-containing protein [Planctomycetes bacterium]|nr:4Fe-4S dicluster domain-containing protein [Planctomycetota bacterium]
MDEKKNIQWVINEHLCVGCGTCVAVCSNNAIRMLESPAGLLAAEVNTSNCNFCGRCNKVCPGTHLEEGLLPPEIDPFKGSVVAAYCGQAEDENLLEKGQSGGVVTALLCHFLETGRIDHALITQMPEDESLRPKCILTSDPEEIHKAQGSKYCPVALNEKLVGNVNEEGKNIAVVGLPCHFHGIMNMQQQLKNNNHANILKIGLVCDRTLSYAAIDHLINQAGENKENINSIVYRSKGLRGWPGDVCIKNNSGKTKYLLRKYRYRIKDTYTPLACRLCFDKMNFLADLVVGDAYKVKEDAKGHSIIIARSKKGQEALLSARKAGVIQVDQVDPKSVFKGQKVENKRRYWTAFTQAWKEMNGFIPDINIESRWYANIQNISLESYKGKLHWAKFMEGVSSTSELLKTAKRRLQIERFRNAIKPQNILGYLWRKLTNLKRKFVNAN